MEIEDLEAMVAAAVSEGRCPSFWRIAPAVLNDLIRRAPGGAAFSISGAEVIIAGLAVTVSASDEGPDIELISERGTEE